MDPFIIYYTKWLKKKEEKVLKGGRGKSKKKKGSTEGKTCEDEEDKSWKGKIDSWNMTSRLIKKVLDSRLCK